METAQLVIEALQLAVAALAALSARRPRPGKHERKDTPLNAPATIQPEPLTAAAAARPRDPQTGRVLLPIRAEGRLTKGAGFRKYFASWAEAAEWLASPEFTAGQRNVKSVTLVWQAADPDPYRANSHIHRPSRGDAEDEAA